MISNATERDKKTRGKFKPEAERQRLNDKISEFEAMHSQISDIEYHTLKHR